MIARSARTTIVSVEQIVSAETILTRPIDTILPRSDVTCVVEVADGAHPCCDARYDYDLDFLGAYHRATATVEGFATWLDRYAHGPADQWAYLDQVGTRPLMQVSRKRTVHA